MTIDFMPLVVFVLITTFTPGPGNIASAAMGMMYGYRRTLRFLSGIVAGYLLIMLLCAWAFSGAQIQGFIHLTHIRRMANFILVTLLVYCAVNLSGIFTMST